MSEEKRTYESQTQGIHNLRLQSRPNKVERKGARQEVGQQDGQVPRLSFTLSREMILRLIEWMKED